MISELAADVVPMRHSTSCLCGPSLAGVRCSFAPIGPIGILDGGPFGQLAAVRSRKASFRPCARACPGGGHCGPGNGGATLRIDCGGVPMELMANFHPGAFTMGLPADEQGRADDETQHRVEITRPFYMGITEVTQEQYEAITGINPSAT